MDIFGTDTYIYTACGGDGIRAYHFNGYTYTLLDTQDNGSHYAVWANDTCIFSGESLKTIAYTFDGSTFTGTGETALGGTALWVNDSYVYVGYDTGLAVYRFVSGDFTQLDTEGGGGVVLDLWGDGTYIYSVMGASGLRAYSFVTDTDLIVESTIDDGTGTYEGVWGDGTYIYTACGGDGIRAYTFDGTSLTLIDTQDDGGNYETVWGNGSNIYVGNSGQGLYSYTFDGTDFTLTDVVSSGNFRKVWENNLYVHASIYSDGVRAYSTIETKSTGETFGVNATSLDAGTYNGYRAAANNSDGTAYGANAFFLTKPNVTSVLNVSTYSPNAFNLSWIKGDGANTTYIERNNVATWTRGEGLFRYNGTGIEFNDSTNLFMDRSYYYQAWSFTNWTENGVTYNQFSDSYVANNNKTDNVTEPENGASTYYPNVNYLKLTWERQTGTIYNINVSTHFIVVQRNDTYTTGINQSGNWIRKNSSEQNYNFSWATIGNTYFTIWGYNETSKFYSTIGLNIPWGALKMQCFDETTYDALKFDIVITNSELDTYSETNLTNIHYLDMNDIPFGADTVFYISNDTHESRTYYYDIFQNNYYDLTFYLTLSLPSDGGDPENESYSTLYLISIVNEYDEAVEDVRIQIMRYIDEIETYENVSILTSDANGQADIYVFPGEIYKVKLSKTGYITRTDDWIPNDAIFTKTFKIYFEEETFENATDCNLDIVFNGHINGNNLIVNYTDNKALTINTTIYIYEYNQSTGNTTLLATYANSSTNIIQITIAINTSNSHYVYLYYNHDSICGNGVRTRVFPPLDRAPGINITKTRFDNLFTLNYGINPFGWSNTFCLLMVLVCLFTFGARNSGISIMLCGGMLLFVNFVIGISVIGATFPIVCLVLGFLRQWQITQKESGRN